MSISFLIVALEYNDYFRFGLFEDENMYLKTYYSLYSLIPLYFGSFIFTIVCVFVTHFVSRKREEALFNLLTFISVFYLIIPLSAFGIFMSDYFVYSYNFNWEVENKDIENFVCLHNIIFI
ncbi:hypothetical protein EIN_041530 [Entamoeba invadens IP1]|uniref:Uncharacterized protein n=1 Tax=Entamoeba invadens IP1 TaxID=370355 RepID=A0A0A1TWI1_ENTIV|nr:hypothetical protein EIN_041530 [Entamoeba invadens IP1]ELP85499.1 hypothetical protein EIN_041530 [Entamoeba invadens IP1]|eukprot:XP_004184845.1 hypothetical protein EIN_041530 [Entamoeba invadens IP1]